MRGVRVGGGLKKGEGECDSCPRWLFPTSCRIMGSQNVFLWPPGAPKCLFSLPKGGLARVATPDFLKVSQAGGKAAWWRRRHPAPRPTALCDAQHGGRCHPPPPRHPIFLFPLISKPPLAFDCFSVFIHWEARAGRRVGAVGGVGGGREGVGSVVAVKCL